ncbi:hypothetical protein [Selenomonas sp. AB3002]|uniref:hypothetical protein n=1 Tax=Selenomonas sp. AB3002 TaxID=1392502 RepID=UPI0004980B66
MDKTYIAIDLKSFYASVECVERGLDPLTTALVVADESRSDEDTSRYNDIMPATEHTARLEAQRHDCEIISAYDDSI